MDSISIWTAIVSTACLVKRLVEAQEKIVRFDLETRMGRPEGGSTPLQGEPMGSVTPLVHDRPHSSKAEHTLGMGEGRVRFSVVARTGPW